MHKSVSRPVPAHSEVDTLHRPPQLLSLWGGTTRNLDAQKHGLMKVFSTLNLLANCANDCKRLLAVSRQ